MLSYKEQNCWTAGSGSYTMCSACAIKESPSDLQQKQLVLCCVSVNHLETCGGAVMLCKGFSWLELTASPGSEMQTGKEVNVVFGRGVKQQAWARFFHREDPQLLFLWGYWSCRHLHHSRICPKCLITTDHPCFRIFSFTPRALWELRATRNIAVMCFWNTDLRMCFICLWLAINLITIETSGLASFPSSGSDISPLFLLQNFKCVVTWPTPMEQYYD